MTAEVRHLRCFLAVAEAGTITRAAELLHLSQPAVSRTLRQLEHHLGVVLVDRSTHHLELTEAGRALRARAAAAVAAVDDALDPRRIDPGPLVLGHAWSALGARTTTLLRRWRDEHPDVPLVVRRIDARAAGLAERAVDVAIVRGPLDLPGVSSALLATERRMAGVPTDGPLAAADALRLADLAGETFAFNDTSGTVPDALWTDAGLAPPATTVAVSNVDDWLAAIASGGAVGITSASTAAIHALDGVAYRPLVDAPGLPLRLAWPTAAPHPAVEALVRLARDVLDGAAAVPGTGPDGADPDAGAGRG